jgi:hypothetical protein
MRYADGGGLTSENRSRREQVRQVAAEMFAKDAGPGGDRPRAAGQHEVSLRVAARLARRRREGPGLQGRRRSPYKLDEAQLTQPRAALEAGPAACGRKQDQRWTLPGSPR